MGRKDQQLRKWQTLAGLAGVRDGAMRKIDEVYIPWKRRSGGLEHSQQSRMSTGTTKEGARGVSVDVFQLACWTVSRQRFQLSRHRLHLRVDWWYWILWERQLG